MVVKLTARKRWKYDSYREQGDGFKAFIRWDCGHFMQSSGFHFVTKEAALTNAKEMAELYPTCQDIDCPHNTNNNN